MIVKILIGLLVLGLILVSGALFLAYQHLQSPEFQEQVVRTAEEVVGSELRLDGLEISLLQGVVIRGLAIGNPPGLEGDLLTVDEVVIRYRLFALLSGRVEIERLLLRRPVVKLVPVEEGRWNFEAFKLGKAPDEDVESETSSGTGSLDFALSNIVLEEGQVVMSNGAGEQVTRVENLGVTGSLESVGGLLSGTGMLKMDSLELGKAVALQDLRAPTSFSNEEVKLSPVSASLAQGEVSGDITLKLVPTFRYLVDLEIQGADVTGLLQESGIAAGLSGKLESALDVEGRAGLPTVVGEGTAQVVEGKLTGLAIQDQLAGLLKAPALKEIEFTECVIDFTLADNLMETPSIRLISPLLEFTGSGEVTLPEGILNHDVTLGLHEDLLKIMPTAVLQAFEQREDGFRTIPFRVWGPMSSPETDLQDRLVKGALAPVLNEGIDRLKNLFR